MGNCPICGGVVYAGNEVLGYVGPVCGGHPINTAVHNSIVPTSWYEPKEHCEHCYCRKEVVFEKTHKKCCQCGDQKVVRIFGKESASPIQE